MYQNLDLFSNHPAINTSRDTCMCACIFFFSFCSTWFLSSSSSTLDSKSCRISSNSCFFEARRALISSASAKSSVSACNCSARMFFSSNSCKFSKKVLSILLQYIVKNNHYIVTGESCIAHPVLTPLAAPCPVWGNQLHCPKSASDYMYISRKDWVQFQKGSTVQLHTSSPGQSLKRIRYNSSRVYLITQYAFCSYTN